MFIVRPIDDCIVRARKIKNIAENLTVLEASPRYLEQSAFNLKGPSQFAALLEYLNSHQKYDALHIELPILH